MNMLDGAPRVEFECPVCDETVTMQMIGYNDVTPIEHSRHSLGSNRTEDEDMCNVFFSVQPWRIRYLYEFVEHDLPIIYTRIEKEEEDKEVFKKSLEGVRTQGLGVWMDYEKSTDSRFDVGSIYGWRTKREVGGGGERYIAVTDNIHTQYRVHSSESFSEFREFFEKWF